MNRIIPMLFLASVSWTACEPAPKKTVQDMPGKPVADLLSVTAWTAFETVYSRGEDGSVQKLGVKYLPDNKIKFRLSEKNNLCDVEYEGIAQNLYPDSDGESDDDEEGNAYFAIEYIFEDDGNTIYIRIAEEKDKARIKFSDKTREETDCVPSPNFLLKR